MRHHGAADSAVRYGGGLDDVEPFTIERGGHLRSAGTMNRMLELSTRITVLELLFGGLTTLAPCN
jgi:hypothetical protein